MTNAIFSVKEISRNRAQTKNPPLVKRKDCPWIHSGGIFKTKKEIWCVFNMQKSVSLLKGESPSPSQSC